MFKTVADLILLPLAELHAHAARRRELERGRQREIVRDRRVRQEPDAAARLDERANLPAALDEAEHRRHAELADAAVDVAARVPVAGMPFDDEREVPAADFPPVPARIPHHADIGLVDPVTIRKPAARLDPPAIRESRTRSAQKRRCQHRMQHQPAAGRRFFLLFI